MTDAKKTSELNIANTIAGTDRLVFVANPSGNVATETITLNTVIQYIVSPYSANNVTIPGQLQFDSNYLYVTTPDTTIKKVAIT
jgi:hypothetical protein